MSTNILSLLDWSKAKKDWCAGNVASAFNCKPLGNAFEWMKYIDSTVPQIGFVAVFNKGNKALTSNPNGLEWGHVGVVTAMNKDETIQVYDGPGCYDFKINYKQADGFISIKKMEALGAKIGQKEVVLEKVEKIGFYEKVFNQNFPAGSTIFKDLAGAKQKFQDTLGDGDIAYFVAIGLERIKTPEKNAEKIYPEGSLAPVTFR